MTSLGILTVATNRYVNYWKELATSVSIELAGSFDITMHVFTDDVRGVTEFGKSLHVKVRAHQVEPYAWPEATLYRYELISRFASEYSDSLLMHVDADMIVRAKIDSHELLSPLDHDVCLVRHPGFYRPKGAAKLNFYLENIQALVSDAASIVRQGGIGSWESNSRSLAFVLRGNRKIYFCGGVWWGRRTAILDLCRDLASRVRSDETKGVMAVWHDESHLNWWATQNRHGVVDPSFCFAEGYPQLRGLPKFIQAVDKSAHSL